MGDRRKARAVGAANGRNPISIVVPCHRVVGSNGALTGFAGGVDTKAWLLDHERQVLTGNDAVVTRGLTPDVIVSGCGRRRPVPCGRARLPSSQPSPPPAWP